MSLQQKLERSVGCTNAIASRGLSRCPNFRITGLRVFLSSWISLLSRKHSGTGRAERIPSSIQFSALSQRGRWRIRGDSAVAGQGHSNIPPAQWRRVWAYCATLGDFARARFYSQQLPDAQPMARQGPLIGRSGGLSVSGAALLQCVWDHVRGRHQQRGEVRRW